MTDRELLELAAKAAGYEVFWYEAWHCFVHAKPHNIDIPPTLAGQRLVWAPLTDDGDALRLAVKLQMSVDTALAQSMAMAWGGRDCVERAWRTGAVFTGWSCEPVETDPYAATRRAIVRAAAACAP